MQDLEKESDADIFAGRRGNRAVSGKRKKVSADENWRDYILFYEYFNGDNGFGLGASHQTGWTGLIGKILQQIGEYAE